MWIKLGFKKKIVDAAYIQVRSIDRKLRYTVLQKILKIPDQNGVSLLYIMLKMQHSSQERPIYFYVRCWMHEWLLFQPEYHWPRNWNWTAKPHC